MYTIKNASQFKTGYLKALDYITLGKSEDECAELENDHDVLQGIHAAYYEKLKEKFVDSINKLLAEDRITDSIDPISKAARFLKIKGNLLKTTDGWDRFQKWALDLEDKGSIEVPIGEESPEYLFEQIDNAFTMLHSSVGLETPDIDHTIEEDKLKVFRV